MVVFYLETSPGLRVYDWRHKEDKEQKEGQQQMDGWV